MLKLMSLSGCISFAFLTSFLLVCLLHADLMIVLLKFISFKNVENNLESCNPSVQLFGIELSDTEQGLFSCEPES